MFAKYSNFTQSGAENIMAALPPTHQGEIIYIIGRCHGNKAPISVGAVSVGGGF